MLKPSIAALLGLSFVCAAGASQPCALAIAHLVSEQRVAAITAKFSDRGRRSEDGVRALAERAGSLSGISPAELPRLERYLRISAVAGNFPAKYWGYWVDATSSKLGTVQLHIAVKPGTSCTLSGIFLDVPLEQSLPT